jgi:hypothetical protein
VRWEKAPNGWQLFAGKQLMGVVYRKERGHWVWSLLMGNTHTHERTSLKARRALLAGAVARILEQS